ncbi:Maf family protein [Devriesea agamarum]|uniref:Maf family protein n=1 Tax=Devriesea agamarum TaxID=472569 RepID=UPI000ABE64E6|nr:Maf family protein [Devriesea agamarum]
MTLDAVSSGWGGHVLVLASASPGRRALLTRAGIAHDALATDVDEEAALRDATQRFGDLAPEDQVLLLAQAKAQAAVHMLAELDNPFSAADTGGASMSRASTESGDVNDCGDSGELGQERGHIVLGCDSMLEFDGQVVGKPLTAERAIQRWRALRGGTGILHSGHWLIDDREEGTGATLGRVSSTALHFANLSDDEIDAYVATGEPLQVAGAFTIDGLGGPFITGIEGDPHGVIGLSLPVLRDLLTEIGVPVTDLWTSRAMLGG